ncbi:MAG: alpha-amylase [Clostridia bacterium]|nr:alpha-amylase [Clostridia bacterium]
MAKDTSPALRDIIIYSVFVRNHTPEGTLRALIPDLDRIKSLGADYIWLLPVCPIGEKNRKGTLGSPYANRDYRAVNPEYGDMNDLRALADAIHEKGLKLMLDIVYNHTSPDSVLCKTHPEWFYRKDGKPYNRVGEWSDVRDLDYGNKDLWAYQTETLKKWAEIADGFRCDASSLVPTGFWRAAREACEKVKPGLLWLGETVYLSFNSFCRRRGIYAASDGDAFAAFDIEYEYDIKPACERFLRGEGPLSAWTEALNLQEAAYPENYNKLRFLENHDRPRAASLVPDPARLSSLTALLYFLKGATLIYAGQEYALKHLPTLFDRDTVDFTAGTDMSEYFTRLARIKKEILSPYDSFYAASDDERNIAVITRDDGKARKIGVFPLSCEGGRVKVDAPDGEYEEKLSGGSVSVKDGALECAAKPLIISFKV